MEIRARHPDLSGQRGSRVGAGGARRGKDGSRSQQHPIQAVDVEPVVTVWYMTGPALRTRRNRPVFTFRMVRVGTLKRRVHRWLANPLPPFPGGVNVTSAPGLEDLLVRASPRFVRTLTVAEL